MLWERAMPANARGCHATDIAGIARSYENSAIAGAWSEGLSCCLGSLSM